jgi:hypothetical protein
MSHVVTTPGEGQAYGHHWMSASPQGTVTAAGKIEPRLIYEEDYMPTHSH